MKWIINTALLLISLNVGAQVGRNIDEYNPSKGNVKSGVKGVGLYGYDPVSYFPEGGSEPQLGLASIEIDFEGVRYRFVSSENLDVFLTNPEKYEPTYGGWCAYAMSFGSAIDINPLDFSVNGNRLHLFRNARVKRQFDRDVSGFESRADQNWKEMSGEDPRF